MARTKNRMRRIDRAAELQRLDIGRLAAIALGGGLYGSEDYLAARKVVDAIDALAEHLTGNKCYFHARMTNSRQPKAFPDIQVQPGDGSNGS